MIPLGGIILGFPLLAGLFGWSVLGRFTHLDKSERFAASWGLSFGFLAGCQFLSFVFHANQTILSVCICLGMLVIVALFHPLRGRKAESTDPDFHFLVLACGLAYLHLVCIQALLPDYRGSHWYFDWWMHYDEALVFLGDRPVNTTWANGYTLASRTPLYNLTTAFVMSVVGHDFASYQIASALTNIAFVAGVYLVLRDLFGLRAARLAVLLAPVNLWMLHNAWYTWPKMLVAYYLIMSLHFYIRAVRYRLTEPRRGSELFVCFGISALSGFMTHQVGLVYVFPLVLHSAVLAWRDRAFRPHVREVAALSAAVVLIVLPWYGWLAGTLGVDKITHSTPATLGNESARYRPQEVLGWMTFNAVFSVVPTGVIHPFFTGWPKAIEMPQDYAELQEGLKHVRLTSPDSVDLYRGATELYFSLLTGALTISLLFFVGYRCFKRRGEAPLDASSGPCDRSAWWALLLFVVLGGTGAALVHPGKIWWGIAHSAAFPSAILLTGLAWGVLSRAKPRVGMIVSAGILAEFLAMFWSHLWFLARRPEVLENLPGNAGYKDESIVFFNDRLGDAQYLLLAGAVVIQLLIAILLLRYWRTQPQTAAEYKT
jgi:hypothetical protein